jgi:hypothetical protein
MEFEAYILYQGNLFLSKDCRLFASEQTNGSDMAGTNQTEINTYKKSRLLCNIRACFFLCTSAMKNFFGKTVPTCT